MYRRNTLNGTRIRAAAEQGDPSAQLRLGTLYDEGSGVERDPAQAAAVMKISACR